MSNRTMALVNVTCKGRDILVRITEPGRQQDPVAHYFVKAVKGDFGVCYTWDQWEHPGKPGYTVDTSAMTCNCYWGRKRRGTDKVCRHVAATMSLQRQGALDGVRNRESPWRNGR